MFFFRDDDVRLLLLIVASSFIIISMMVIIGVVSCILLCFEDTLHDEEQLVEHILQVSLGSISHLTFLGTFIIPCQWMKNWA